MFEREYQEQILRDLNDSISQVNSAVDFVDHFDIRFQIMCQHIILTFLPYSDFSPCFVSTYFQSLAMNMLSLMVLPFYTIGNFIGSVIMNDFFQQKDFTCFENTFKCIFNIVITLIILTLEIVAGLLSLVSKPLITLGFLMEYTANFLMNFFNTPENLAEIQPLRMDIG